MNIMKTVLMNIGKILLLSFVLAGGLVVSRIVLYGFGYANGIGSDSWNGDTVGFIRLLMDFN